MRQAIRRVAVCGARVAGGLAVVVVNSADLLCTGLVQNVACHICGG